MRKYLFILPLAALLFTTACQSSGKTKIARLDKIEVGMDKDQVLNVVGFGPRISERKNGQDRWIYEVYPNRTESITHQKEVRFEDGKVVYAGEVQKPAISAAEQDRLNATAKNDNVNIDAEMKRESRKQSVDLREEIAKDMPAKPKFEEVKSSDETAAQ